MTDSAHIPNLSVYLGQSNDGIGIRGEGSSSGGGEQYLAAEGELHNTVLLTDIKQWLTLDAEPRDQLRLDELEAWSSFNYGEFTFVCRMVLSGKDETKRRLYFSHARAWNKKEYDRKYFDPNLFAGSDKDFEEPWKNDSQGNRIKLLSSMEGLQKAISSATKAHKKKIEKYLAYLLYGLLIDKTIIISADIDSFERSGSLYKCITLVLALMPLLEKKVNMRLYTSTSFQKFIQSSNLVVIPSYLEKNARKENTLLINIEGESLEQDYKINKDVLEMTSAFAKNAINGFFTCKACSPFFSYKSGVILQKHLSLGTELFSKHFSIISQFSYELADAIYGDNNDKYDYLYNIPSKYCNKSIEIDWHLFLSDSDLALFQRKVLLQFSLNSFPDKTTILQNRIVAYLLSQETKLTKLLSENTNLLTSSKYYQRAEELSKNGSKLISKELLTQLFGSKSAPEKYISLRQRHLEYYLDQKELPNDLLEIAILLESVISVEASESILLTKFRDLLLLREDQVLDDFSLLKKELSHEKFYYFVAHVIDSIANDISLNSLNNGITKTELEIIDVLVRYFESDNSDIKSQTYLQSTLTSLVDNEKSTLFLRDKSFLSLRICNLLKNKSSIEHNLQNIWETTKQSCEGNNENEKELISNKWINLGQECLFSDTSSNQNWILKYPAIAKKNLLLKNKIGINQLSDLILSLNKEGSLDNDSIEDFCERLDSIFSSAQPNKTQTLQLILEKNLWLFWRTKTKLTPELLHDLAVECIFSISSKIKSIGVWDRLISDCIDQRVSYIDLAKLEKNLSIISFIDRDYLPEQQLSDLLKISKDYNVIDLLVKKLTPDLDISIKVNTLIKVKKDSDDDSGTYITYLRIYYLSSLNKLAFTEKFIPQQNINIFLNASNPDLRTATNKAFVEIINNNLSTGNDNEITQTLTTAKKYKLFDNISFIRNIDDIVAGDNDRLITLVSNFLKQNESIFYNIPQSVLRKNPKFLSTYPGFNLQSAIAQEFDKETIKLSETLINNIQVLEYLTKLKNSPELLLEEKLPVLDIIENAITPNILKTKVAELRKVVNTTHEQSLLSTIHELYCKESVNFLKVFSEKPLRMSNIANYIKLIRTKEFSSEFSKSSILYLFLPLTSKYPPPPFFKEIYLSRNPQDEPTVRFLELLTALDTSTEEGIFDDKIHKEIISIFNRKNLLDRYNRTKWINAANNTIKKRVVTSEYARNPAFRSSNIFKTSTNRDALNASR